MKSPIITMSMITLITLFAQCKKGGAPSPGNTDKRIEDGKYIIRSKYMCNGGCFVFTSYSNYEAIKWEWMTKEYLESIKNDATPYNPYIWNIVNTGAIGSGLYIYADPSSQDGVSEKLNNPLAYYAIYQQKPDGFFNYLPQDTLPYNYASDAAETGGKSKYVSMVSTEVSPGSSGFDTDLARVFIRPVSDSTYRITLMRISIWATYFSLLVNPNGSDCDELEHINNRPTWRDSWLCPHTSSIGNAWNVDACYTSQLIVEKVD